MNITIAYYLACIFLLFSIGCKKNDPGLSSTTRINSISPSSGKYGINDTIRGYGFGNNINTVQFFFGTKVADIIYLTDSLIIVAVPRDAESGYVSIIKENEKVNGPAFQYIYTVTVSTVAGNGLPGYEDGEIADALFYYPRGIATDSMGNIFVADYGNSCIRKISVDGTVSTIAGNRNKIYRDGPASDASFLALNGIAFDYEDNLYIADAGRIRKLSKSNNIISTLAGNENAGNIDGTGINAQFNLLYGIILDTQGNLVVTDVVNNNIRKVTPAGIVTTMAGYNQGYSDGNGIKASFNFPGGICIDAHSNNMYIADAGNFRIRLMNAAGDVNTYAGNGSYGYKDGRFFEAEFKFPTGITIDNKGNVYVCGEENAIRKISANGDVSTIAGSGIKGYNNGSGEVAMFNQPVYMCTSKDGAVYVSDHSNHSIRKIIIE